MPTQKLSTPPAKSNPLLGNLSAETFLRDYWQKKPLLIRQAFPDFDAPLTIKEILALAKREEAESRLIMRRGGDKNRGGNREKNTAWQMQQGPLKSKDFRAAADSAWTVLIQDTQHFSHEAQQLLQRFNFIPYARIDDLMVSYAVKGGGVGPHFDSYDVFLLQGHGQRSWQVSAQQDLRLQPDKPLKILAHFKAEDEWLLNPGDMLYLPPGYAHHGVAETDDCVTWSVGFRAPSQQELAIGFLDYLRDEIKLDGQYQDGDLQATTQPGVIGADMLRRVSTMLDEVRTATADQKQQQQFLGRHLTEPKSHVYFDAPEAILSPHAFTKAAAAQGLILDLKTRLLYDNLNVFLNGEPLDTAALNNIPNHTAWQTLADGRRLTAMQCKAALPADQKLLYEAYCSGYIHLA